MGDLVPAARLAAREIEVRLQIGAPSWVRPRKAWIYVNGHQVAQRAINALPDRPTNQTLKFTIERPPHDSHTVAFVLGDSIKLPGWTTFGKATQAITNPVYLDVDGDDVYTSPRDTAKKLVAKHIGKAAESSPAQKLAMLEMEAVTSDPAILSHVKDLLNPGNNE